MNKGVLTSYKINGTKYSSYILGGDMVAINNAIVKRALNEIIDSQIMDIDFIIPDYTLLSDDDILIRKEEVLHSLCFLSFIGLKSKNLSIEEVVGDEGCLHELSHLISNSFYERKKSLNNLRDLILKLKNAALGIYQPV